MRRTKEEAEQTRQALLDAALAAFSDKGYQATRLQEIAEMAGTTRGAIYHHFENKADLYKQLLEEASQQGSLAVQTAVTEGGSFADICRRIFVTTLEMLANNERFRQVMALSLFKTGVSPELAQIESERLQNATAVIEGIAAYMQVGIETGEVRTNLAPDTIARTFLALQNGAALLWLANGEFFSLADDAPIMADIFLQGILQSS
ncbi:MAG: TetR family transcriptional regulator [Anaerolineae bacterium]|jgi:TetR/AcrR family transcriptional regulator, acrAB operon repressor